MSDRDDSRIKYYKSKVTKLHAKILDLESELYALKSIDKDKNNCYYVYYKSYSEYNQFEGSWDISVAEFTDWKECNDFINYIKDNDNHIYIAGPLIEVDKAE